MSFRDKIDKEIENYASKVVDIIVTRQNQVTTNQGGAGKIRSFSLDQDGNRMVTVEDTSGRLNTIPLASSRVLGKGDQVTIDGGFAR